jgi:hypothetical protein
MVTKMEEVTYLVKSTILTLHKTIIMHRMKLWKELPMKKIKKMRKTMRWAICCKRVMKMTAKMKKKNMIHRMMKEMEKTMMTTTLMKKEMR